ncbi:MAG TPA: glycosyltransferase [Candidatus Limnocylindrales bacterium]|nr:glycosyltransferase [Candidatus Limnocylindrales bacterium]
MSVRRILIAAPVDFAGYPFGGTGATIEEFLTALPASRTHEFTLIGITKNRGELSGRHTRRIREKEFEFIPVAHVPVKSGMSRRVAYSLGLMRRRTELTRLDPDLAYAHTPEAAVALRYAVPNVPIVLHCHGTENPVRLSRFPAVRAGIFPLAYGRAIMAPAVARARAVVVTADTTGFDRFRQGWSMRLWSKFHRVPSMISTDVFYPQNKTSARARMGLPENGFVVVCVGRLERSKGVQEVLSAVAALIASGVQARLVVVGDGSYRGALERTARALEIEAAVSFLGYLPRSAVATTLNASDVFLTASWKEGFSVALLEALACGVPVVSADVGGVSEVVRHGVNGFIAQERGPGVLAGLLRAVHEREAEMRHECTLAADSYSAKLIAPRILDILDDASASRRN